MPSKLWDRNNPLFIYGNEEKLNDLLGRIFGEVDLQFKYSQKEGGKGALKLAAKFGGFLSALGIGEVNSEVAGEIMTENVKERIATITFDSKVMALQEYCIKNEEFPYINVNEGLLLKRKKGKIVQQWKGRKIEEKDKDDMIGYVLGVFASKRVIPPHDEKVSISDDILSKSNNLWNFCSVEESIMKCEIPFVISNIRALSQHALMALIKSTKTNYKIEALGLITWESGTIICDPITWRLFY